MRLLKCKDILYSNGLGGILVTLEDGRCACVSIRDGKEGMYITMLLAEFLKWGSFNKQPTEEEIKKTIEVVEDENVSYKESDGAKEYLTDPKEKEKWDRIKKKFGYDY